MIAFFFSLYSLVRVSLARVGLLCVGVAFCLSVLGLVGQVSARDQNSDKSVLQRSTDTSWYSADKDELVAAMPASRNGIDVSDRDKSVKAPKVNTPLQGFTWPDFFGDLFRFLLGAWLYIIVGIILLLLVAALVYFLMNTQGPNAFRRRQSTSESIAERDQAKITDLPFEIEQSTLGLLEQAGVFRSRGEYSKAIIYLFSHVLVELDAAGHIRLTRGKTNRVYLRELGSREAERKFTSYVVRWFEHVFFGKHEMDPQVFEKIWSQLPAFDRQIKNVAGETARV